MALLFLFTGVGATAGLAVHAQSAGAAICRDLAPNQPSPVWNPGVSQPPSCTDWAKFTYHCGTYSDKASVYVGGNVGNYVRLAYSSNRASDGDMCRMVWGHTQGAVWSGIFFTRTTWTGNPAQFYEDTLGLPLSAYGPVRWTRQLRDNGRRGFTCGYDGRNWICSSMY